MGDIAVPLLQPSLDLEINLLDVISQKLPKKFTCTCSIQREYCRYQIDEYNIFRLGPLQAHPAKHKTEYIANLH